MIPNAMPPFDFGLGETADALREQVQRFSADQVAPIAAEIDKTDRFPRELWPKMGELGLHGITVEEEYGGSGLGYLEHVIAVEEVSRASAAVGLSYGAHSNLCVNQIRRNGTDEQKKRFLPKLISGEHVGSLAMSEVGRGLRRRLHEAARRQEGRPLRAERHQDVDHQQPRRAGDRGLCQDRSRGRARAASPPSSSRPTARASRWRRSSTRWACAARRPASWCSRIARSRAENVLGAVGKGVNVLMSGLDYERAVLAAGPLGIMQAAMDVVVPYVHERKQFGQAIGEFQLVQGKLADMYTTMNACKAYVYAVAKACDRGQTTRKDSAGAILYAAEKATMVALDAIQLLGGNGYINDYPTGRLLRDAKLYEIGAGTSEIRRMLIGRELFAETA